MNPIRGVLEEELANSIRMLRKYQQAWKALPRGSLVEKKIKGKIFHYSAARKGGKVKFEYKGRLPVAEIAKFKESKAMRAKYRGLMADLRKQIAFLRRSLHERKRRSR